MHRTSEAEKGVDYEPHYHTVRMLLPKFLNKILNSLCLCESNTLPSGSRCGLYIYGSDFAFKFCSRKHKLNAYLGERSKV